MGVRAQYLMQENAGLRGDNSRAISRCELNWTEEIGVAGGRKGRREEKQEAQEKQKMRVYSRTLVQYIQVRFSASTGRSETRMCEGSI